MERPKSLGSLILLNDRLLAVDAALKEIIETLEPDVHQFWLMRITLRNGNEYPVPYYGMIIRRFIDSFVLEQSDVRQAEGVGTVLDIYYAKSPTKKAYGNLTVLQRVAAGNHLWRERRLHIPDVFFSDDLQAEMTRRGLRIGKYHPLKAI